MYYEMNLNNADLTLVDEFESLCGGFKNKTLVDLGAGPGQFTLEFLKRGANATWWDVSHNYMQLAKQTFEKNNVNPICILDYMDNLYGQYDLVFNRICWYYCFDDASFLKAIYDSLYAGGSAYLVLHNEYRVFNNSLSPIKKALLKFTFYINEQFNFKVGHVMPSTQKIRSIFSKYKFQQLIIEERGVNLDSTFIFFQK